MRRIFITALVAGIVIVAGCGGGDGNVRPDEPPPEPIVTSSSTMNGTSAADLMDYLKEQASGGPWGPEGHTFEGPPAMPLWIERPTVRVWSDASAEQQRMVASAVDLINDWLPIEHRMVMGEPTPLRMEDPREVPRGEIHVSLSLPIEGGESRYGESYIRDDTGYYVLRMVSNLVAIDAAYNAEHSGHELYGVIVHELLHAVGLPGHVFEGDHPDTLMPDTGNLPGEAGLPRLPRIDGEALMTAYVLYDDGETDADIDFASLGPWATTIPALHGTVHTEGGNARFGVEYRTQWTRAWDEGPMPATTLAVSGLTGTATWTGDMVGFTDTGTAVEGDAGITVELADMDGTAAFTDIMTSDASWGPDLSTDIGVTGNYFADMGNEPRLDVEGQFRGTGHEAATGVLRWEDTATGNLTGAFGTKRDEP